MLEVVYVLNVIKYLFILNQNIFRYLNGFLHLLNMLIKTYINIFLNQVNHKHTNFFMSEQFITHYGTALTIKTLFSAY